MQVLISAKIDEIEAKKKEKHEVSWRYIIGKGLQHIETCVPRGEIIQEAYTHALKTKRYTRLAYWLQQKYPKVWDEFIKTDLSIQSGVNK